MILGGCGYTSGPFNLYRLYASFLPKLKNITPEFISIISKIVGGLFYIMFVIMSLFFLPRNLASSLILVSSFSGTMVFQMTTITNDVPMFFLGMCILILFLLVLFRQKIYKQAIMLLLCSVLLFVLRKTDVSWVSSLPFFFAVIISSLFYKLNFINKLTSVLAKKPMQYVSIFGVYLITTTVTVVTFFKNKTTLEIISKNFYFLIMNRMDILRHLEHLSLTDFTFIAILKDYLKSLLGKFIWGHSSYDNFYYVFLFSLLFLSSLIGPFLLRFKEKKLYKLIPILHIVIVPLTLIHLIMVFVICLSHKPPYWIFAEIRMTAPATAVFFAIPSVFLYNLLERKKYIKIVQSIVCFHFIVLTCYYLPKFFISDVF